MTDKSTQLLDIDWPLSVKLAADKPEVAKELLEMLVDQLPKDQDDMQKAYQSEDWAKLRDLAHRCLGATCYVGAPKLKQACENLETVIKNKQFMFIPVAYEAIESAIKGILTEYKVINL